MSSYAAGIGKSRCKRTHWNVAPAADPVTGSGWRHPSLYWGFACLLGPLFCAPKWGRAAACSRFHEHAAGGCLRRATPRRAFRAGYPAGSSAPANAVRGAGAWLAAHDVLWVRLRPLRTHGQAKHDRFTWLIPPSFTGTLTVAEIVQESTSQARTTLLKCYVAQFWSLWQQSYGETIAGWYARFVAPAQLK
jgi:hypothetical protein